MPHNFWQIGVPPADNKALYYFKEKDMDKSPINCSVPPKSSCGARYPRTSLASTPAATILSFTA